MDKALVNNQIVLMRKVVRKAKCFVYQKLVKQLRKLKTTSNKSDELSAKYAQKILNKEKHMIALKGVNVDEVSKQALIHDKTYFDDIIKSSKSCLELKCLAKIAVNEDVWKAVNKFKEENPNCDQWLPSQIELWHQKNAIKRNTILKKKGLKSEDNVDTNEAEVPEKINNESDLKKIDVKQKKKSDLNQNNIKSKPKEPIIKKKEIKKKEAIRETEEKVEPKKVKFDPFFITDGMDDNEEQSDDSIVRNDRQMNAYSQNRRTRRQQQFNQQNFSQRIEKNGSRNDFKPNNKTKTFGNSVAKTSGNTGDNESSGESLHPSWAARRSAKDKFKINLNDKPMAKKIKFTEN
ncbi:unnamed protein product [Medioppia subpectinata]|uniref:Serum response factor-binding protein 1 n=1 Tax=Medioppia subpectinata TaxID=1979941 RepID=A0A7R9KVR6_9ACAR|nr:unnamed protein product [Medioppia subpectinata]CAG2110759.1 unnamed protein product [Medioppia subpectinata]